MFGSLMMLASGLSTNRPSSARSSTPADPSPAVPGRPPGSAPPPRCPGSPPARPWLPRRPGSPAGRRGWPGQGLHRSGVVDTGRLAHGSSRRWGIGAWPGRRGARLESSGILRPPGRSGQRGQGRPGRGVGVRGTRAGPEWVGATTGSGCPGRSPPEGVPGPAGCAGAPGPAPGEVVRRWGDGDPWPRSTSGPIGHAPHVRTGEPHHDTQIRCSPGMGEEHLPEPIHRQLHIVVRRHQHHVHVALREVVRRGPQRVHPHRERGEGVTVSAASASASITVRNRFELRLRRGGPPAGGRGGCPTSPGRGRASALPQPLHHVPPASVRRGRCGRYCGVRSVPSARVRTATGPSAEKRLPEDPDGSRGWPAAVLVEKRRKLSTFWQGFGRWVQFAA